MTILIIVIVLLLIPVLAAAFMSEDFKVETGIDIKQPKQLVFDYVKLSRNGDHYNKWMMQDPDMQKDFFGTDGTVGFIYKWKSEQKNAGEGEQEITAVTANTVDYEIRFIKPFANVCQASIQTKEAGNGQTHVNWSFTGKRSFVMRIFHFLFNLKKVLTKDMNTSLTNLKAILEK